MPITDTVRPILTSAASLSGHSASLPECLPAAAWRAVVRSMLKAGLLEEATGCEAEPAWRSEGDQQFGLRAIAAGLDVVGPRTTDPNQVDEPVNLLRLPLRAAATSVLMAGDNPYKSGLADAIVALRDRSRHEREPLRLRASRVRHQARRGPRPVAQP